MPFIGYLDEAGRLLRMLANLVVIVRGAVWAYRWLAGGRAAAAAERGRKNV